MIEKAESREQRVWSRKKGDRVLQTIRFAPCPLPHAKIKVHLGNQMNPGLDNWRAATRNPVEALKYE
ncbi:MAG: hypothetical protein K0B11_05780 [Mariniphaga sp.]|nr:hypothetical protein [Mariniphaga sp.]